MAKPRSATTEERVQIAFLLGKGLKTDEVNNLVGTSFAKSTMLRFKKMEEIQELIKVNEPDLKEKFKGVQFKEPTARSEKTRLANKKYRDKKKQQSTIRIEGNDTKGMKESKEALTKIEESALKYFDLTLEEVLSMDKDSIVERRDLMLIGQEFERLFGVPATENIIYSFQEKYLILDAKGVDALKAIVDKIRFVYRRTISDTHKWKFSGDDDQERINKIMGHIINLIKSDLDGSHYGAVSEHQKKLVEFYKKIWKVQHISYEVEMKIVSLQARFDSMDIINTSVQEINEYNPELEFLNRVEEQLKKK